MVSILAQRKRSSRQYGLLTVLSAEQVSLGIAKAKAAGVYKDRPASLDAAKVRELKAQGLGPSNSLCSRSSMVALHRYARLSVPALSALA
jgi:DNA invertase Pin-like site-specific DNA recombinase